VHEAQFLTIIFTLERRLSFGGTQLSQFTWRDRRRMLSNKPEVLACLVQMGDSGCMGPRIRVLKLHAASIRERLEFSILVDEAIHCLRGRKKGAGTLSIL
jgi:hypothetical protein